MAERNLSHLNYGHVGEAAFSLETREWSFGRKFTTPTLEQIGVRHGTQMISTEVVPASIQFPTGTVSTRLTDAKDNIKSLLRHHPQLVPVSDFIAEPSVTSAAILSTTATYDPLLGSLFATGSVTLDQETRSGNWESPRRVAATATGEAGNILCLTLLNKQTLGWDLDKTIRLGGVTFRDADQGYWNEDAAPIQQICFAESEDRSNLLAVRLPTRIVIFRPVYWQHRRFSGQSSHYELPASILDARPILNLDIKQSGGTPHADIAFNPDFQLQFAVVDQNHAWSIWDIDSSRKSDVYTMSCLVQGHIVPKETDDSDGEDGWARIIWVGDVNTVLICTRRQLSVIGFQGGSFEFLPCPPLFSPKSSDWILDVKRHPVMRNQFLVLTSTSLFLMAVTTSSDALDLNAHHVGTRIVTSWRHYRSAEDFTLSISVQMLDEDNLCVLSHSRLNTLIQMYTYAINYSFDVLVSSNSPTMIEPFIDGAAPVAQIALEPLLFAGDTASNAFGVGRLYYRQGLQFYKLFILRSDLSVHEMIVYSSGCSEYGMNTQSSAVKELGWSTTYRPRRYENAIQEDDDILDVEGFEATKEPLPKLPSQMAEWTQSQDGHRTPLTFNFRYLYDALSQKAPGDEPTIDIPSVTNQLRALLIEDAAISQSPLGTLMEFAGMRVDVPDIDEASSSLLDLLTIEDKTESTEIRRIASTHVLHISNNEDESSISSLYDSMLQNWVAPLPPNVPLRVRQHKERLARRIAAEVTLASTRICQRTIELDVPEGMPVLSQDSGISMPILSSQPLASSSQYASHLPFSQPLPSAWSPQRPQPQNSLSQNSLPFSSQTQFNPLPSPSSSSTSADPVARLSKYLKFKDDATPSAPLPPSVNQLLSHWQPGTDPRTYDWEAIERADRADNIDAPSQQQVEKERRRKERRDRKQKREDELARSQPSSQPFTFAKPAIPRSSPGPTLGGMSSSSQVPSQSYTQVPLPGSGPSSQGPFGAQSQVEPGRFGGRPEKKKKKKRVGGF